MKVLTWRVDREMDLRASVRLHVLSVYPKEPSTGRPLPQPIIPPPIETVAGRASKGHAHGNPARYRQEDCDTEH